MKVDLIALLNHTEIQELSEEKNIIHSNFTQNGFPSRISGKQITKKYVKSIKFSFNQIINQLFILQFELVFEG